ncbi:7 transmembrane receptor (rhodopsin family) [Popillia japonica]|uniref:7 transmembrane receptor (Rhodopsin family) n=1 Tax=Popillia japonica TaxID=7064 RepID=A0AAW1N0W0_POPJA
MSNLTQLENETIAFDSFYFYETEQFTLLWILFIAIVFGNCGVLYKVLRKKARNHRMNYFIRHLAIADLLVGLVNVLTDIIWRFTISWNLGNAACKIIRYLQVVITYGSTYILVSLSIDRCDAIRYPMQFSSSWRKARILIWSAWFTSVIVSLPIIFLYNEKIIQDHPQCWIAFEEQWQWRLYMSVVAISLFIIPVIIISYCYSVIIFIIRSRSKKLSSCIGIKAKASDSSSGIIPKAKIKTVKISLVIVAVFILCWSPYIIFDLLQVYGYIPATQTNIAIASFIQSLTPLNSAANPLIYFIFSTHFSRFIRNCPLLRWFGCKYQQKPDVTCNQSQISTQSEILTSTKSNKFEF